MNVKLPFQIQGFRSQLLRAVAAVLVLVGSGVLLWFVRGHFIARALSSNFVNVTPASLRQIVAEFPTSKALQLRLAELLQRSEPPDFVAAQLHAEAAVRLSPRAGYAWYQLGLIKEANGDQPSAEAALQEAVRLTPNDSEMNWALANALLRAGKLEQALPHFRVACQVNAAFYPVAFDTLWRASGQQSNALMEITSKAPLAQIALAQFLVEQQQAAEAQPLLQQLDAATLVRLPQTAGLFQLLLTNQQPVLARELWLRIQQARLKGSQNADQVAIAASLPEASAGEIWDGGFELPVNKEAQLFGWRVSDSNYVRIRLDTETKHRGKRALQVQFLGRDTTRLREELSQQVALQPGARYRLSVYVKTKAFTTPEGPVLAIFQRGVPVAQTANIAAGTTDWQLFFVDFVVSEGSQPLTVVLLRVPRYAYDEPTSGLLWLDDVRLERMN